MEIVFNPPKQKPELLKSKDILDRIDQADVFAYYLHQGAIRPGKKYSNPLRDDKHASCYFTWTGRLRFNDPARDTSYDLFDFVSQLRNCSLQQTLQEIWQTQVLCQGGPTPVTKTDFDNSLGNQRLFITTQDWSAEDHAFWGQGLLTEEDLYLSNSYSVGEYQWKNMIFKPKDLCYGYHYVGQDRAKLYMPYSEPRFLSDIPKSTLDGLGDLIPGKPVILSKSRKDRLVCTKAGIPNVIDAQAEAASLITDKAHEFLSAFPYVVIWWDNDVPGKQAAEALHERRGYRPFLWPESITESDPFDLVSKTKSLSILTDLIGPYL